MKTFSSKILAAAAAGAMLAVPSYAQERAPGRSADQGKILVQPQRAEFARNVGRELNRELYHIDYPGSFSGVVRVLFTANPGGEAQDVRVVQSSGRRWVDRAATRAVARLNEMGAPPSTRVDGQPVLATIVYATDQREMRRLSRGLEADTRALLASGELDPDVLALTIVPDPNS